MRSLQEVLSVSNEVAAELATIDDGILEALRDRFGCTKSVEVNEVQVLHFRFSKVIRSNTRLNEHPMGG